MIDVIVVGGGPIGLLLSAELALQGVSVSVLEKALVRDPRSRAVGMQANTLDALCMRGMEQPFLDAGTRSTTGHFGAASTRLDLSILGTPYPFSLMIRQSVTEDLLEQHARSLGVEVQRGHEVVSLTQNDLGVEVVVRTDHGLHTQCAAYVVGCDGTRSVVRTAAGIDFRGTATTSTGWLADVELTEPIDGMRSGNTTSGSFMIGPIGGGLYRAAGVDVATMHLPPEAPVELAHVQALTRAVLGTDLGMHSPVWLSRYGNATRQAEHYRAGRLLLAGDAAHQFFPAGGQGMNLGLQDAMNLGWRLAAVVSGRSTADLLDSYELERIPVARAVMENTRAQLALFAAATPEQMALRDAFSESLADPTINALWARRVAGFDEPVPDSDHPLHGTRISGLHLTSGIPHTLLTSGRFVLLDLGADLPRIPGRLNQHTAALVNPPQQWVGVTAALLRPDGRVAWVGTAAEPDLPLAAAHAAATWCPA